MLYRKIEKTIFDHLKNDDDRVLIVDGARQVGKTYIINHICKKIFKNYIEINLYEDSMNDRLFSNTKTVNDFFLNLSSAYGHKMNNNKQNIVFLDEIQVYPHLISLLKFLNKKTNYKFIASGSLLGVTLADSMMSPMGSTKIIRMFPLDFEEFLIANNVGVQTIEHLKKSFNNFISLNEPLHNKIIDLFKKYLLVGGMPQVVNSFIHYNNITEVRSIQNEIYRYYINDASQYDKEKKLNIQRIYELVPSLMENKKKRIVVKDIQNKKGKTFSSYKDDFDYLISAGVAINVQAITNPVFPLLESVKRNLIKLYLNDVGLLTNILYKTNILPIVNDDLSINLGSIYETVVATELYAHNHNLFYFDSKKVGEVDFIIDDYNNTSALPIEVKSGRDYTQHRGINNLMDEKYKLERGIVLSNNREILIENKLIYMPIYYAMFL